MGFGRERMCAQDKAPRLGVARQTECALERSIGELVRGVDCWAAPLPPDVGSGACCLDHRQRRRVWSGEQEDGAVMGGGRAPRLDRRERARQPHQPAVV